MRICVLGAGVVGLTTAWMLAEEGHDVTIIDRNDKPGQETSQGNGGQLSYITVSPLASPSLLRKLPGLLLHSSGPVRIKPHLDLHFIRWGIQLLSACRSKVQAETVSAQLALAALSRAELLRLTEALQLEYRLSNAGKLLICRNPKSFQDARRFSEKLIALGIPQQILSPAECLAEEPALKIAASGLAGGIFSPQEQVGDCALFCEDLGRRLRERNSLTWLMNTPVLAPIVREDRLVAVSTSQGDVEADAFVLSLGSYSALFAKKLGVRLPIYPMKGYSFTSRLRGGQNTLRHSVTDADNRIVFTPFGEEPGGPIRVAGIADFVGYNLSINPSRFATVRKMAAKTVDLDDKEITPWTGLRPMTPDSRPIIGWSPVKGLFLNTGHGMLGWTLACGSARLTAELMMGRPAPVEAAAFSWAR